MPNTFSWNVTLSVKRWMNIKGLGLTLLATVALSGCGGGGGGSQPSLPGAPPVTGPSGETGRFVPNYSQDLHEVLHWETTDISIYVAPNHIADFGQMMQVGTDLWVAAAEQKIRFHLTDDAEHADITVRLVPAGSLGSTTAGRTSLIYHESMNYSGWQMLKSEIVIDEGLDRRQMFDTVVHELGHALGIDGHSSVDTDAMYPISEPPTEITIRDANTLKTAYAWLFGGDSGPARSRAQSAPRTITVNCPRH